MNVIKVQRVFWGVLIILMRIGDTFACQGVANCETYVPWCLYCLMCLYDRGSGIQAYQLSSDGRSCTQLCSWRPDSTFCYPGRCTDGTPSSCTCAASFGGNNCLTITTPPVMQYCMGKLKRMVNGLEMDTIEAPCTDSMTSPSVWTNIGSAINSQLQFEAKWETSFQVSLTDWPPQYYMHGYRIGVISASVDWWLQRGGTRVNSGTVHCLDGGISRDNPQTSMHDCVKSTMMTSTPLHGDRLYFTTKSSNGGYVRIRNYDGTSSYAVNPPVYFTGREVSHTAYFSFDFESPYHCSVSGDCTDNMLDRGPAITRNGHLNIRWSGWRDDDAGLGEYEYEVFLLAPFGDELQERHPAIMTGGRVASDVTGLNVILNETGVYSIVLTVEDACGPNDGNYISARRFLIFDNRSTVEFDTSGNFSLWVDSVASNSTWQTDLQDGTGNGPKVVVKWPGHFYNQLHRHNKFLNPIKQRYPPIASGYEELTGLPPATRSREAIPNANGIVMFQTSWGADQQGGRTLTGPPDNWVNVTNVMSEQQDLDIARQDGDTICIWVRAFDVMGNVAEDNVTAHVDSSPPIVDSMFLLFHMEQNLPAMKMLFTAYDDHSGLHDIRWEIHDLTDTSVVHGEGQIPVKRQSVTDPGCHAPLCNCNPIDEVCYVRNYDLVLDADKMSSHFLNDSSYYFIITATNNAMLRTRKIFTMASTGTNGINSLLAGYVDDSTTAEHGIYAGISIGAVLVGAVVGVLAMMLIRRLRVKKAEESEVYEDVVNRNTVAHQRPSSCGGYDMPMEIISPRPQEESVYQELKPVVPIYEHLRKT